MQTGNHKLWKPSSKLFYGKYHTSIKLGLFPSHAPAFIPKSFSGFRVVNTSSQCWTKITSKIYTNNQEVIDYVMDDAYLNMHVLEVTGPVNEQHYKFMKEKDRTVCIRDKLWFGKFQHKMSVFKTFKNIGTVDEARDAYEFIKNEFTGDSRLSGRSQFRTSWVSLPSIFTNDEAAIFLFKMAYSQKFTIKVESIITLSDVLKA